MAGLAATPPSLPSGSATHRGGDGVGSPAKTQRAGRKTTAKTSKKRRKPPKPPPRDRAPGAFIYLIIIYSFARPPSRGGNRPLTAGAADKAPARPLPSPPPPPQHRLRDTRGAIATRGAPLPFLRESPLHHGAPPRITEPPPHALTSLRRRGGTEPGRPHRRLPAASRHGRRRRRR